MAVTYGFFNSVGGDRKYTAEDFANLFEGIIKYGIFNGVGEAFKVQAIPNTMQVRVGTGRAMLSGRWINNDAPLDLQVPPAHTSLHRIDSVVLDMDYGTRSGYIRVITGNPSTRPIATTTKQESPKGLTRYILANITVYSGQNTISQSDIASRIGTSDAPWVTGPLQVLNTETATSQFLAQASKSLDDLSKQANDKRAQLEKDWTDARNAKADEWSRWFNEVKNQLQSQEGLPGVASRVFTLEEWKKSEEPKYAAAYVNANAAVSGIDHIKNADIPAAIRNALGAVNGPNGFLGNASRLSNTTWRYDSDYGTMDVTRQWNNVIVKNLMSYPWVTSMGTDSQGTRVYSNPDGSMGFWGATASSLAQAGWVPMYVDLTGLNGQQVYLRFMYVNNADNATWLPKGVYNTEAKNGLIAHTQPWTQKAERIYTAQFNVNGGTSSARVNFQIPGWGKECTVYQAGMYSMADWNRLQLQGFDHGFSLSDKGIYRVNPQYSNNSTDHAYVTLNIGGYTDTCTWTPKGGQGVTQKYQQTVKPYGYDGLYTMEVRKL